MKIIMSRIVILFSITLASAAIIGFLFWTNHSRSSTRIIDIAIDTQTVFLINKLHTTVLDEKDLIKGQSIVKELSDLIQKSTFSNIQKQKLMEQINGFVIGVNKSALDYRAGVEVIGQLEKYLLEIISEENREAIQESSTDSNFSLSVVVVILLVQITLLFKSYIDSKKILSHKNIESSEALQAELLTKLTTRCQ